MKVNCLNIWKDLEPMWQKLCAFGCSDDFLAPKSFSKSEGSADQSDQTEVLKTLSNLTIISET